MAPGPVPARVDVPPDPRDLSGPFRFRRPIEVRFADTDAMGHVNNAVYLTYCEAARAAYYEVVTGRSMLSGLTMQEAGHGPEGHLAEEAAGDWRFILAEARVTYRSPAFFGETLTVETRAVEIGRASFRLEQRITAPASPLGPARLVAVADSVLVGYDYERGEVRSLPPELVRSLEAFEGRPLRPSPG